MKSTLIFAFLGTSFVTASNENIVVEENMEYRILAANDLQNEEIKQFCRGKMDGVILSIEGTTLAINVDLKSNIFDGEKHSPRKVKVLKPCFMKCEGGRHYFSSDYKTWQLFKDFFDTDLDLSLIHI